MQSIYPVLRYEDAQAAIGFLERAFGFERHAVHEATRRGNLWSFGTYRPD